MNLIKTTLLLILMAAVLMLFGGLIGGARGAMIAFLFSLVINGVSYWYSDKIVLSMYGASELSRQEHPAVYDMVTELSGFAGIPMPRIYSAPVDAPNAFATGRDPEHSAVCVTRGALRLLDRDELRGVLSHELAHIRNRDTLTMTVTAALASAIMMLANMARWGAILGGSRDRENSSNVLTLVVMAIVAPLAALLVQMAISRSREYAADALGAKISRDPGSLARALEDLASYAKRSPLAVPPQTAHLFIVNPFSGSFISNLFSTHPPMAERVRRLRSMA